MKLDYSHKQLAERSQQIKVDGCKVRDEQCVTALKNRPDGRTRPDHPKQHGGEQLRKKGMKFGRSHERLSER